MRYVISDIHGEYSLFVELMKKKQKIRVEKTERGVEVYLNPEVWKLGVDDIPKDADILHIPANSKHYRRWFKNEKAYPSSPPSV